MRRIQRSIAECIAPADFVALTRKDLVSTAVSRMLESNTSCALVVEDDRLLGIFTGRDFVTRVSVEKRDPTTTRLGDVMTESPDVLSADDCISYAIHHMAKERYRHIPIIDGDGKPISVLDTRLVMTHLIKVFAELEQEPVGDDDSAWVDIGGG